MKHSVLKLGIPHLFVDATDEIHNIHDMILEYLKL